MTTEQYDNNARLALDLYWTCRMGNHHMAGSLISKGAEINVCHPDSGEAALHTACSHAHFKVVKELLSRGANANLQCRLPRRETALHCIIRSLQQNKLALWYKSRALQCLKLLLLNTNIKVNIRDGKGYTPLHVAVELELWEFAEHLIASSANLDIEINGTTTRILLQNKNPGLISKAPFKSLQPVKLTSKLFYELSLSNQDTFIELLISNNFSISTKSLQVYLQLSSVYNYTKVAKILLDNGGDPYNSYNQTLIPPIILAAKYGSYDILKLFLELNQQNNILVLDHELWRRNALHYITISASDYTKSKNIYECLQLLLDYCYEKNINIDGTDFLGNTPLHYATKSGRRDIIRLILQYKPSIFIKNYENTPAFIQIHSMDLRKYFDSCIQIKSSRHEKFPTLIFDYKFLQLKNNNKREKSSFLEMEPLIQLSRSSSHRPLLHHPIIRLFLHLKWQKLQYYFYINFILYFLFTVMISIHIHFLVVSKSLSSNLTDYEYSSTSIHNIIRWLCAIFLLWPLCREILELIMSPRRYIKSIENLMETTLVVLSIILLFVDINNKQCKIISAIVIILVYTDLILLIGRHPRFSTYITMFTKVSSHFLGFFFLFSFLIFAFAFTFFIIFHDCDSNLCESKFFNNLGSSIFKTIVMLSGELEAETLTFDIFSYIVFVSFVLFITICLLNLLTGLAVSDITVIRDDAEVDSCNAKVKLYAKLESILLGQSIEGLHAQTCLGKQIRKIAEKTFSRKVRLFGTTILDDKFERLLAADRATDILESYGWKIFISSCFGRRRRISTSGPYRDWQNIISEAHCIAVGEEQLQGRGFSERLDIIESKLTDVVELLKNYIQNENNTQK